MHLSELLLLSYVTILFHVQEFFGHGNFEIDYSHIGLN